MIHIFSNWSNSSDGEHGNALSRRCLQHSLPHAERTTRRRRLRKFSRLKYRRPPCRLRSSQQGVAGPQVRGCRKETQAGVAAGVRISLRQGRQRRCLGKSVSLGPPGRSCAPPGDSASSTTTELDLSSGYLPSFKC